LLIRDEGGVPDDRIRRGRRRADVTRERPARGVLRTVVGLLPIRVAPVPVPVVAVVVREELDALDASRARCGGGDRRVVREARPGRRGGDRGRRVRLRLVVIDAKRDLLPSPLAPVEVVADLASRGALELVRAFDEMRERDVDDEVRLVEIAERTRHRKRGLGKRDPLVLVEADRLLRRARVAAPVVDHELGAHRLREIGDDQVDLRIGQELGGAARGRVRVGHPPGAARRDRVLPIDGTRGWRDEELGLERRGREEERSEREKQDGPRSASSARDETRRFESAREQRTETSRNEPYGSGKAHFVHLSYNSYDAWPTRERHGTRATDRVDAVSLASSSSAGRDRAILGPAPDSPTSEARRADATFDHSFRLTASSLPILGGISPGDGEVYGVLEDGARSAGSQQTDARLDARARSASAQPPLWDSAARTSS